MTGGLYAIVDPGAPGMRGKDPERVAEAILRGGCAMLQLRAKGGSDRALLALARRIAARCEAAGVPFVVNDRPDIALLAGARGLHLGQDDLPIAEARRVLGGGVLREGIAIGRSTHDEDQAREAVSEGADLVAFGPIWATASKADPDPVVGLERLASVCRATPRPVIAIGGVTLERAEAIVSAGARYGAVISALCGADDPELAARALHSALGGGALGGTALGGTALGGGP